MIAGGKPKAHGTPFAAVADNPQTNPDGVVVPKQVVVDAPELTAVVDSVYNPINSLLRHIEGANWPVTYYRQILSKNDQAKPLQLGTTAVHQQYEKIIDYNIKVNSALSQSQDQESKEFEVTGDGTLYYGIVPNYGDMFLADVGDGRLGIFTVTDAQRLTYSKAACYNATWKLVTTAVDAANAYLSDLESKVVRTLVFDSELLEMADTPFVTQSEHIARKRIEVYEDTICRLINERFWSKDVQSTIVPNQVGKMHDAWHAEFCRATGISDVLHPIRVYQNGNLVHEDIITIWNLIEEMSLAMMPYVTRKLGYISAREFYEQPSMRGIYWSQYDRTVYPVGKSLEINNTTKTFGSMPTIKASGDTSAFAGQVPGQLKLLYPDMNTLTTYVFSEAFYDNDRENMTWIEYLTHRMLDQEPVNSSEVLLLCESLSKLRPLEQFYYAPIVFVLIKYTKRGTTL